MKRLGIRDVVTERDPSISISILCHYLIKLGCSHERVAMVNVAVNANWARSGIEPEATAPES
ncbi:hypothetical protein ACFXDF_40945, partial [Streptomyces sp. NPDC059426]|uniref:hypothetical protein n=1 Tax=Streptomyces sp. NPDC059426 TaxID=3346827 RepID=UPI003674D073